MPFNRCTRHYDWALALFTLFTFWSICTLQNDLYFRNRYGYNRMAQKFFFYQLIGLNPQLLAYNNMAIGVSLLSQSGHTNIIISFCRCWVLSLCDISKKKKNQERRLNDVIITPIYIIRIGRFVCLSVCLSVCVYPFSAHCFSPIGMKLGMDTPWDPGGVMG